MSVGVTGGLDSFAPFGSPGGAAPNVAEGQLDFRVDFIAPGTAVPRAPGGPARPSFLGPGAILAGGHPVGSETAPTTTDSKSGWTRVFQDLAVTAGQAVISNLRRGDSPSDRTVVIRDKGETGKAPEAVFARDPAFGYLNGVPDRGDGDVILSAPGSPGVFPTGVILLIAGLAAVAVFALRR